jgi:hypothetical protein
VKSSRVELIELSRQVEESQLSCNSSVEQFELSQLISCKPELKSHDDCSQLYVEYCLHE